MGRALKGLYCPAAAKFPGPRSGFLPERQRKNGGGRGRFGKAGGWSDVAIPLIAPSVRRMLDRLCWSTRTGRWSAGSHETARTMRAIGKAALFPPPRASNVKERGPRAGAFVARRSNRIPAISTQAAFAVSTIGEAGFSPTSLFYFFR